MLVPAYWKPTTAPKITPTVLFTYHTLILEVDLITQYNKREIIRVSGTGLYEKLIPPAIQVLKSLGNIYIEYKNTAVRSTIEGNTETLEPLLPSSIPDLIGGK